MPNSGEVPVAGFNFFSQELNMTISNTSSSSISQSFAWDLGDGNTSTDTNPSHTYSSPGIYTVCLFATNECGTDTICREITLSCLEPDANFSWSAEKLSASFEHSSIRYASISWDFGDGSTSSLEDPDHNYNQSGTYTVCLLATSICGVDTFCQEVTVSCPKPEASFQYDKNNLSVFFSDQSQEVGTYLWDFGDGSTSTEASPSHSFDSVGIYEACLIVENICGKDTLCETIEVDCPKPTAGFIPDASNLNVIFIDQSSFTTSYVWDFGDGTMNNLPRPFHSYEAPGTYTACQIVINDCGRDTLCQEVSVSCPGPQAGFSYQADGLSISFLNNSTPEVDYNWDFGDGNTSKEAHPFHSYDSSGIYLVSLEASTLCGADTSSIEIEVSSATSIGPDELLSIQVYPNPSDGVFYLEYEDIRAKKMEIEVFDIRGKRIWSQSIQSPANKSKEQINLKGSPPGVYLLNITTEDQRFVKKITLQ
ncbi:MAG: PKD domain-containing protein [Bacteroidota bacterium]